MAGNICVPIELDAFVLNPQCCESLTKIAPITQPNYVALRLDNSLIRHDVLEAPDIHLSASRMEQNPRISDLGDSLEKDAQGDWPGLRRNRLGVYVHWSLPRCYRSATSYDEGADTAQHATGAQPDNPVFRIVPDRWIVIRRLKNSVPPGKLPDFDAWVIESNRVRNIDDIEINEDLEVDVSPFVRYNASSPDAHDALKAQAEVFLGFKTNVGPRAPQGIWNRTRQGAQYVDLTVMNSSNPLFPDYIPHNANVFSILDNFAYTEGTSSKYLEHAEADYFVVGFHSKESDEPLAQKLPRNLKTRLQALFLNLGDAAPVKDTQARRLVCHGAIYAVTYDKKAKPQIRGDTLAANFSDKTKIQPISIGSTPLDGILTFLEAHKRSTQPAPGVPTPDVANDILDLAKLLYAVEDDYDSRVRAEDLLRDDQFDRSSGGARWHLDSNTDDKGPTIAPSPQQSEQLTKLNDLQYSLDCLQKKLSLTRWYLFAEWWKFVSDKNNRTVAIQNEYSQRVRSLAADIRRQLDLQRQRSAEIDDLAGKRDTTGDTMAREKLLCKESPAPTYSIRSDPTICIAGLDSAWPSDYMSEVTVREAGKVLSTTPVPNGLKVFEAVPDEGGLRYTIQTLIGECIQHTDPKSSKGFKQWGNIQPFKPLFLEWEGVYYHIDLAKWSMEERPRVIGSNHNVVKYGVKDMLHDENGIGDTADMRTVSGRIVILPQPVFQLENVVEQVLDQYGTSINMNETERKALLEAVRGLQFLSAPMSGFTEHLITCYEGGHVKPTFRMQGHDVVPLAAAVDASHPAGFDHEILSLIDDESALTPYANLLDFGREHYAKPPFKGLTHGQFLFTKLDIVDKFGQVITVVQPERRLKHPQGPPASFYPSLGDHFVPNQINGQLNTVYREPNPWPLCRFLQFTPSINQEARLNAAFLTRVVDNHGKFQRWQEATDWEQPILGWVVINYADSGLQFFFPDGRFYREVRLGGPARTSQTTKWLPFDPPSNPENHEVLDELIGNFTGGDDARAYLQAFFNLLNNSADSTPYAPAEYASTLNSLVGKPLALVDVGLSLELATSPFKAQNTLGLQPSDESADLLSHQFPIKIGDQKRPFDGLVGYYAWDAAKQKTDWKSIFTYFTRPEDANPNSPPPAPSRFLQEITPATYPKLSPFYIDPMEVASPAEARWLRVSKYLVTTMIIDPFAPIHVYSSILPIKSLKLPKWTVQSACRTMTAFFRLGPSLVTEDVPPQYAARPLNPDSWRTDPPVNADKAPAIKLPIAGTKGMWNWLQPYADAVTELPAVRDDAEADVARGTEGLRYNALPVQQEDGKLRLDPAPYTMVEGYLQMARPLQPDDFNPARTSRT